MMSGPNEDERALRAIADELAAYRRDATQKLLDEIKNEAEKVDVDGFDPARGRGRGPRWADGE